MNFFTAEHTMLQHKGSSSWDEGRGTGSRGKPLNSKEKAQRAQMVDPILAKYLLLTSQNGKPKASAFHVARSFIIFVFHIPEDIKGAWKCILPLGRERNPPAINPLSCPRIQGHGSDLQPSSYQLNTLHDRPLPWRAAVIKAVTFTQKNTTITSEQTLTFLCPENLNSLLLLSIFLSDTKQKEETNQKAIVARFSLWCYMFLKTQGLQSLLYP